MYHTTNKELIMLQILTNMFMTNVQHIAPPAANPLSVNIIYEMQLGPVCL